MGFPVHSLDRDFTALIFPVKDYYAILGVGHSASQSDIKKAYRKLAIVYHPDKNASPDAKSNFQDINEAYDVLSDTAKKSLYDSRLANPLQDLYTERDPPHRDPAYRRRRKPRPSSVNEPPATYVLMRDSLKYVMWASRVGLLITVLFFVDYFLPYERVEESIAQLYPVRTRTSQVYHVLVTESGDKIKLYDLDPRTFGTDRRIVASVTAIYGTVMKISNASATYTSWVAYMYRSLIFIPIVLFVNSVLAFIYRRRVEFCFNLNVTAFILVIINLILL